MGDENFLPSGKARLALVTIALLGNWFIAKLSAIS